ncbi:hypothetical protein F511_41919 [Dorcoceras hygrometricum]|uniref:Uncharacterized protein n=1 Tax=Dorcoceras hygrometricum TaxID=472368 RepID=A0A2Z7D264_9LAMI|nr:hypothetical protein F511_41919 [Dorcoceras hygrometricum]
MVVDSVGIFEMKGQYYTLALTNWFLQALSVIPRESWDDVARRFTMIRCPTPATAATVFGCRQTRSGHLGEEIRL